jgi:hypothetical protein
MKQQRTLGNEEIDLLNYAILNEDENIDTEFVTGVQFKKDKVIKIKKQNN